MKTKKLKKWLAKYNGKLKNVKRMNEQERSNEPIGLVNWAGIRSDLITNNTKRNESDKN